MAPEARPIALGRPAFTNSVTIQPTMPAQAPSWVLSMVMPDTPLTPAAEPTLKPNQPTHSSAAPAIASGRLCGRISTCG
ncbi:hypothetical protein D9M71_627610 [compost metagenome]